MRKRLVYFAVSLAVALSALVTQFAPPRAVAQQPSPGHPTEECRQCAQNCIEEYFACTAVEGNREPGFGTCVRQLQECRRTCFGKGGPCNPQTDTLAQQSRQ